MNPFEDQEHRFRAIVESQTEFIVCWLPNGVRTYVNEAYARYFGLAQEECVGTSFLPLIALPEDRQAVLDKVDHLTLERPFFKCVHQVVRHDGVLRWQEWTDYGFFDDAGKLLELQSVGRDIHDQRMAEEAARASQQMLRMIIDNIPQGVFWKDRNSRYLGCNQVVLDAFECASLDDICGKHESDLRGAKEEQVQFFVKKDQEVMESNQAQYGIVEPATLADGRTIWMETNKIPLHDGSGNVIGVLGTWQDITQRKKAEEELRNTQANLEQALRAGRMGIWISDLVHRGALTWSDETCRIFGSSPAAFDGKLSTFLNTVHPKDVKRVQEASRNAISETGHYQIEHRIVKKDGSIHWVREQAEVERDASGKPTRLLGIVQDITQYKEAEQEIRHLQKMESIGQLASGIAHDFNNILTVIRGNTDLLQDAISVPSPEADTLAEIITASKKATHLVRQLLLFSRKEELNLQSVDLNGVSKSLAKMLERVLGETIDLRIQAEENLPSIQGDSGMLEQVIMNLVINARDAMPQGGALTVSTRARHLDPDSLANDPDARTGHYVCLTVEDTGSGIHPDLIPRIFDPFFTTKEVGKGTGLGLATVYGIIQQHRGWVEVKSQVNQGSAFTIFLPKAAEEINVADHDTSILTKKGGTETILMVEDDLSVLNLVERLLTRAGYQVLQAHNGPEALQIWAAHRGDIQLLITDIVMPEGINGVELAARLLKDNPGLKVLYTSGYFQPEAGEHIRLIEGENYLKKPYSNKLLLQTIQHCLDTASSG